MPVVVVTDSSSCLSAANVARWDMDVAPLHVFSGGVDLAEGVDAIPDSLLTAPGVSTAGASPAELLAIYNRALKRSAGSGIVAVHISRALSSTWEAARQAASEAEGEVRVVDSAAAGMGVGYAALGAAEAAHDGADIDVVYDTAVDIAARVRCFIVVDRLDHLRRGGRIGTAAAVLGTALAMKPVLHLDGGKLVLREKTRTSARALRKLVEAASSAAGVGGSGVAGAGVGDASGSESGVAGSGFGSAGVALTVHHMLSPDRAAIVEQMLRDAIPQVSHISIAPFGAVLGAHVGPGAVGVVVSPARG